MGYGEVGSNGSVHWRIGYSDAKASKPHHRDFDAVDYADIGKGNGEEPKDHDGRIRVRLRFPTSDAARKALSAAITSAQTLTGGGADVYVFCDVPVVPKRMKEDDDPFWEVRVDW